LTGVSVSAKVDVFDLDTSLRGVYVFSLYIFLFIPLVCFLEPVHVNLTPHWFIALNTKAIRQRKRKTHQY